MHVSIWYMISVYLIHKKHIIGLFEFISECYWDFDYFSTTSKPFVTNCKLSIFSNCRLCESTSPGYHTVNRSTHNIIMTRHTNYDKYGRVDKTTPCGHVFAHNNQMTFTCVSVLVHTTPYKHKYTKRCSPLRTHPVTRFQQQARAYRSCSSVRHSCSAFRALNILYGFCVRYLCMPSVVVSQSTSCDARKPMLTTFYRRTIRHWPLKKCTNVLLSSIFKRLQKYHHHSVPILVVPFASVGLTYLSRILKCLSMCHINVTKTSMAPFPLRAHIRYDMLYYNNFDRLRPLMMETMRASLIKLSGRVRRGKPNMSTCEPYTCNSLGHCLYRTAL